MTTEDDSKRARRSRPKTSKRRNWILLLIAVVVLAVAAKPTYRWLKSKRADRLATQGEQLVEAKKFEDAAGKYRAALQLDPLGYHPLRGAATLSALMHQNSASDLWEQVLRLPQATDSDRAAYISSLLETGRFSVVEKPLADLLKKDPSTRVLLLASTYSAATGDRDRAVEFARVARQRAPQDPAPETRLAELLAGSQNADERKEARDILWKIASSKNPAAARSAIEGLASAPDLTSAEQQRVIDQLKTLSPFTITDALLVADLQLALQPDTAAAVYDGLTATWAKDENALVPLAQWLNLRRQPARVLALFPVETAMKNDDLLLARLDALAAGQNWNEIDAILGRPDLNFPPSSVEAFRARAQQERGSALDAAAHWNKAIALASGDPFRLRFVARFAETSGATEPAMRAYDQLSRLPQHAAFALSGQQRIAAKMRDVASARSAAEKILALHADDPDAIARVAYYDLLVDKDVDANLNRMKELVAKNPTRLEYRVAAALGYLRKHDPGSALSQFKPAGAPPIAWEKTPPSWRAVYAAALLAGDQKEEAATIIRTIPQDQLSAEEIALFSQGAVN